ncbi:MAG TPA: isoprenylcysteine carboxylmethyltransferase family protein [Methyloceanibacter sp.]|nr:isoprenylcysteine carboxylmethyltransferase family protein [Methyloceanibacter sp.]
MTAFADIPPGLMRKFVIRTALWIVFLGLVLFGAAGTIHWPQGRIYLGFLAVVSFVSGPWLAKHDPELFRERLGSLFQREQKSWDKLWVIAMMVVWLGGLVLMALDGGRYHWSHVPLWMQVVGFILICVGFWLSMLTFKANSYAAPVVKIQKERGHRVVTTGPYAYVRHPMYSGALLFAAGTSLLFGSWWGLLPVALFGVLIAVRAVLEEETLKAELEGYADYAAHVRYRLVPLVW